MIEKVKVENAKKFRKWKFFLVILHFYLELSSILRLKIPISLESLYENELEIRWLTLVKLINYC